MKTVCAMRRTWHNPELMSPDVCSMQWEGEIVAGQLQAAPLLCAQLHIVTQLRLECHACTPPAYSCCCSTWKPVQH